MREQQYVPGPLFYGSHAESTTTIGVLFFASYEPDDEDMDPYYMSILSGIMAVGIRRGCNVVSMPVRDWGNSDRTLRVYFDGRCDGLLLLNPKGSEKIITALTERNYPFVLVNPEREDPLCNNVGIDLMLGARMSMDHLFDLGHRRIALLAGNGEVDTRAETYAAYLADHGIPIDTALMPKGSFSPESGYNRTIALMTGSFERPTALFCDTDQIAVGALQALRELKMGVPEDVSVIGFDDLPAAQLSVPALTTIRRPLGEIG